MKPGWTTVALGELCELKYGKSLPAKARSGEGFPVFGSSGLVGAHEKAIQRGPGIIVGRKGSIGEVHWSEDDFWPIDTTYFALPRRANVDLRWLYLALRWLPLKTLNKAAAVPGLNREDAYRLTLALPPLDEQRRIAAILGTSLHSIGCRVRACIWIDDFLDNVYNSTLSSGDIPRRPIRSLGEVSTGKTPATSKADYFGGVIPFVAPGDLGGLVSAKRTLTDLGAQESRLVRAGATMVCCIGATIGKVGIVAEQSAFNQQINAIEWGPDMDDLYGYFTMRAQSDVVAARGSSTTMPILAKSKFEELLIPVAPFEVQEEFARVASIVSRVRSNLVAAWEAERQLFASLQSRAFRGEL